MNLEIFDGSATRPAPRISYRAISINRKCGRIAFSEVIQKEENIKTEQSLYIARNKDAKCEWYIRIDDSKEGIPIREYKGGGYCKNYKPLGVTVKNVASKIMDSIGAVRGCSLLIAKKPVELNGQAWYEIITKNPLRKN